jgi:thioredoxin-related protein
MQRRHALITLAASLLPQTASSKESSLPKPHDLGNLAKLAQLKGDPMVILASLPGCPYCELARRSYLIPYKSEQGLHSWQLDTTDTHSVLLDFAGQKTSPAAYLKALRIKVTPTLLFLSASGEELAPRLEGASVPDFYGAYLDDRLASARKRLR